MAIETIWISSLQSLFTGVLKYVLNEHTHVNTKQHQLVNKRECNGWYKRQHASDFWFFCVYYVTLLQQFGNSTCWLSIPADDFSVSDESRKYQQLVLNSIFVLCRRLEVVASDWLVYEEVISGFSSEKQIQIIWNCNQLCRNLVMESDLIASLYCKQILV